MASAGVLSTVGTYHLSEPVECTLKYEADMLDATHLGSTGGAREFISGPTKWTMSVSGDWVAADATAAAAQLAGQACIPVALTMNVADCVGAITAITGDAYLVSLEIGTPVDGKVSMAVEWQGTDVLACP